MGVVFKTRGDSSMSQGPFGGGEGGASSLGGWLALSHGSQNTGSWFCLSVFLGVCPQIPVVEAPKCWLQPWEVGLGALSPTSVIFSSCLGALGSGMGRENGLPCP